MNVLAFDTSSRQLTVACLVKSGQLSEMNHLGSLQHSENLFQLIDSVIHSFKIGFGELDAYAIGLGPGSFTGLRIGFSVLKGFLAAKPKPVYGCSSLDLIASQVPLPADRLAVVVNARRERIYTALYTVRDGRSVRTDPEDRVLSLRELEALVRDKKTYLAGDALAEYGKKVSCWPNAVLLPEPYWYPKASFLARQAGQNSLKPLDPAQIEPRYLRVSEPEEKTKTK